MSLHISYTAEKPNEITVSVEGGKYALNRLEALRVARGMIEFVLDGDYPYHQGTFDSLMNDMQATLEGRI